MILQKMTPRWQPNQSQGQQRLKIRSLIWLKTPLVVRLTNATTFGTELEIPKFYFIIEYQTYWQIKLS